MSWRENTLKSESAPNPDGLFLGFSPKKRLSQWLATGICGNDITSSCLYVSAISAVFAGVLAPVVLLLVVFLLYLFKKVYTQVVEALPLNGGTYNCLLNCISKFAAAVLSGAVLTSFVGVTGLVQRMALDQCLPQFLLKKNRRGTSHRIIISFFLLCSSIMIVTKGSLLALAGVYTISFLGVMTLFGIGNILLKVRRKELKGTYHAGWMTIIVAITATSLGMLGNIYIDYKNLLYFLDYFTPTVLVVVFVYLRIPILKAVLQVLNKLMTRILLWRTTVIDRITAIIEQKVILFTRGGNLARLNTAFNYIVKK